MARHLQHSACEFRSDHILVKRGKLMMKSEFPMTPSLGRDAVTASQDVAFDHAGRATERLGRNGLPLVPAMEFEEETLVIDDRFGQSPAQMVESKLTRKLQETSLPVSHLQTRTLLRRR
jgi:hypothetical protein